MTDEEIIMLIAYIQFTECQQKFMHWYNWKLLINLMPISIKFVLICV